MANEPENRPLQNQVQSPYATAAYASWSVSKAASWSVTGAKRATAAHEDGESLVAGLVALYPDQAERFIDAARPLLGRLARAALHAVNASDDALACWQRARSVSTNIDDAFEPAARRAASAQHMPARQLAIAASEAADDAEQSLREIARLVTDQLRPERN